MGCTFDNAALQAPEATGSAGTHSPDGSVHVWDIFWHIAPSRSVEWNKEGAHSSNL